MRGAGIQGLSADTRYFTPCPVCYKIGGGGVVERLQLRVDDSIIYVCEECSAAWHSESAIALDSYRVDSALFLERGLTLEQRTTFSAFDDTTFLDSGATLGTLIGEAFASLEKVRLNGPAHLSLWAVDMQRVIGKAGESRIILVVNTAGTAVLDASAAF
ncbi:hypothetical protein [Deinococcus altitudinis]|uniref:hypothetical protein n=1 Tax=Deinococcus altitudinis TaxID=468914 RepID=UPI0038915543